ncbi:MAG: hypothetical protein ACTHM2_06480 [Afipia sp.]
MTEEQLTEEINDRVLDAIGQHLIAAVQADVDAGISSDEINAKLAEMVPAINVYRAGAVRAIREHIFAIAEAVVQRESMTIN